MNNPLSGIDPRTATGYTNDPRSMTVNKHNPGTDPGNGSVCPMPRRVDAWTKGSVRLAILLTACILAASCARERPFVKESFAMGTRALVTIYGLDEKTAGEVAGAAMREIHRIESVMSTWKENSEISRLNRLSRGDPYEISRELYALVDSALYYSKATSGAFDITASPLVRLWGFQGGEAELPTEEELAQARGLVGCGRIFLDPAACTITLPTGMSLDLAGIAKGYGVDRAAAVLAGRGVTSALVNLGGNMYAIGAPPGRDAWMIGIRDPKGSTEIAGTFALRDEGVATSGNYENFVVIDGKAYGHIIDPRTGRPAEGMLSVTAVAPTALAADALSTGLFVLGGESGAAAARALPRVRAVFAAPEGADIRYSTAGRFGPEFFLEGLEPDAQ